MPLRQWKEVQEMLRSRIISGRSALALLISGVSGWLCYTAFPPLAWSEAAWIAWVPLWLVCLRASVRDGFWRGFVAGAVFWLGTLFWLTEVTWAGWLMLSAYCALYMGAFGSLLAWCCRYWGYTRFRGRLGLMLGMPIVWAGLEFMRSTLLTGFAWNPLGNSQADKIALLQIVAWTGVYGLSALIILVNGAIALTLQRYLADGLRGRRPWHPELMVAFSVLLLVYLAGVQRLQADRALSTTPLRVALIQPNIPQYQKWTPEFVDSIYAQLEQLTTWAIQSGEPDLVVWPETAVPDYVRYSDRCFALVRDLTALGAPILVGTMDIEWVDEGVPRFYNSALLFDQEGRLIDQYDKQHLVMFGEYVPLDRFLPFLTAMTPIEASFDAGEGTTIFRVPERGDPFAVLICFEDTVARLSRQAVRKGARLLINQTNVAWFRERAAAAQHELHSRLRAAENGVPVARAANTGVSSGIDRVGRLQDILLGADGTHFVAGFQTTTLHIPPADMPLTFYTRHGDVFGWVALAFTFALAGAVVHQIRQSNRRERTGDDL